MKLATFSDDAGTRIGIVTDGSLIDLSSAAPALPRDMIGFLSGGDEALAAAREAAGKAAASIPLDAVRLEAPLPRPGKFLVTGANYRPKEGAPVERDETEVTRAAAQEGNRLLAVALKGMRAANHQLWCCKQMNAVNGPFDPIQIPRVSPEVIYENELAWVVGTRCRQLSVEDAPKAIVGYMVCNDVTVVDWSQYSPTVMLGKSFDTHGPIGPWIVTSDEVGDPHELTMRTYLNGEQRHDENTRQMTINCFEQVSYLSQVMTLEPGDIATTGTAALPTDFLKPGDVVRCEIEGIGSIENPVVPEP